MSSYLQHYPSSPSYSMSSTAQIAPTVGSICYSSAPPLPKTIITKGDISASIEAYQDLLYAAKIYRNSLVQVSKTASSFGTALEKCARCKGVGEEEMSGFMLAGGLQYLIANHQQILSETLYRRFEIPLMEELDTFRAITQERDDRYQRMMMEKNKRIQEREAEHLRVGRKRQRDLATFRQALVDLSKLADDLERLKSEHYNGALDTIHETWSKVLDYTALITRAELDIYEGIARKGWSGGGLEEIMARCEDPFNTGQGEGSMTQGGGHGEIFSILPSHSILTSPQSPIFNEDKLIGQYRSLTRTFSNEEGFEDYNEEDAKSIFSSDIGKYKSGMNEETSRYEENNPEIMNLSSNNLLDINQKIESINIDILNKNGYYDSNENELKNGFCTETSDNNPHDIHST
ncbi:hypothetical protein T552_00393 [Pneumocystis carinii B80]|uniref:IMD domain-containing protein n=1 Tax=Pneumocystis carinii (strain B80) TaxID=1408658 RepID=A0A0W4ZQP7_PNEC8|nr:hypothetical protein T552_00393 [Pneumocystis carinii B80]KTW30680.1 hypothetical protein T552_00393 [Pneumocystis carinii B80]